MEKVFYFVDTRKNAKTDKPFGIHNPDVAKVWTKEYNNGEGPFKPVNGPEVEEETEIVNVPSEYDGMSNDELKEELDARGVDYKSKATKAELINLLIADDNQ